MNVLITFYKKKENGRDTMYFNGKPVTETKLFKLPLKFGYGSYNEPKVILNQGIQVEDIISIEAEGEMSISSYTSNQLNGDMAEQFNESFEEE